MHASRRLLLPVLSLLLSPPALAADTCAAKAVIGGKTYRMTHCAVALFEDQHSVTLWFSDAPFTEKELDLFHVSSYATDKNEAGEPRTMMHFAFCPGGGKPEASAAAVRSVETSANRADSVLASRQWVFDLPKDDTEIRFAKLAGTIVPGGTLSGRIKGGKVSDGSTYSWDATFAVTLPATSAAAGPGCGN